ncbi:MAG: hypothetical protein M0R80_31240 [Proteobacteria bacterium]|jgi:hypothetical protein|nr:hypothetical protein [Pseudomonadota bacterium]
MATALRFVSISTCAYRLCAFPWGLLAQIVLLVLNVIEELVEDKDKKK